MPATPSAGLLTFDRVISAIFDLNDAKEIYDY